MDQNAPTVALKALTEWWEEMGVEVDQAELSALTRTRNTSAAAPVGGEGAPPKGRNTATEAPVATRPSRNRNKSKTVEDWVAEAEVLAAGANSLTELKAAIEGFDGCPLKKLCEKTVVYDGTEGASVMVLGEGPGGQEDRLGLPFVGKAGQLLDRMLAAIQLDRKTNAFISNVNYWRPPGNRNPEADELAVCRPFVDRMVDLAQPKIIFAMGGVAAKSLLDTKTGITRLRGREHDFETPVGTRVPLIPMFHPAYLLRRAPDKSRAWRDLLLAQARLKEMGVEV
ncbi:MAG: uracil-DNA glycosylase [Pseudomonadota bacterium]